MLIVILKYIYAIVIVFELTYIILTFDKRLDLENCFLSIENFVTVRQNQSNFCTLNDFDLKTFASSYSSPYLIELIQNSKNDCICCG